MTCKFRYIYIDTQFMYCMKDEKSKNGGKDQESIQSSTTPDPGYQWEVTT